MFSSFLDFLQLGFQTCNKVLKQTGQIQIGFTHTLNRPVEGRPVAVIVLAGGSIRYSRYPPNRANSTCKMRRMMAILVA